MPVRPATAGTVHRRLRFGSLAELHLRDLRSFRSEQSSPGNGEVDSANRTITGRAQLGWLKSSLAASTATWQLVGTQVMISPVAFGALSADVLRPLRELLALPAGGLAPSTWTSGTATRTTVPNSSPTCARTASRTPSSWPATSTWPGPTTSLDAGTYPVTPSAATEFVVTSVTSDNVDD